MKHFIFFLILTATASAQFPMVAAWQGETRVPLVTDSLSGLFIAGDVIDSLGKSSGDTTYLLPNRARWWNSYAFQDAYQLFAARKPVVYDSSGARYLSFDGVDDRILSNAKGAHGQPYTVIMLAFLYYGPANQSIYSSGSGDPAIRSYALISPGAGTGILHAGANASFSGVADSLYAWRFIVDGASSSVYLNGVLRTGAVNPGTEGVDGLTFGAVNLGTTNFARGYIYGAAFYHKVLTPTEATAVETWLREECLQ